MADSASRTFLPSGTFLLNLSYDDERERLQRTDLRVLRWRDAWLVGHPHRSIMHWCIACSAGAGEDDGKELAAQFAGLMEDELGRAGLN